MSADKMMSTYKRWPVTFVSGRGAVLTSSEGRDYIDMVAGIAVASIGHAHPDVASAIGAQAERLTHVSNLYRTEPQTALAERLAHLSGGMLTFFGNSGAEAIECALKLARRHATKQRGPHATKIVAAVGGFHGRTFGAMSATGQPAKRAPFEPVVPGFVHVDYGDIDALEAALGDDVAAVLLEPVQGEAGVIVPPPDYLAAVRTACDHKGIVLILDEIQTGLGRTGKWFAAQHFDVRPDVMCLAKALGGGLPIGACLAQPEVAASFEPGDHASTFGGGPVQCAAAMSTLDVIERDGLVERSARLGDDLKAALEKIVEGGAEVRGLGLMIGIEFDRPVARAIAEKAFDAGLLVNDATPTTVRLVPPLVITEGEIGRATDILKEVLDAI